MFKMVSNQKSNKNIFSLKFADILYRYLLKCITNLQIITKMTSLIRL